MLNSDQFSPVYFSNDIKHLIAFCLINNCKTKKDITQLISKTTIPDGVGGYLQPLLQYNKINIEYLIEVINSVKYELRQNHVDKDHAAIIEIKLYY